MNGRKTFYIADDFVTIHKYLKELEKKPSPKPSPAKAPAKFDCYQCADLGFVKSARTGVWKTCGVCFNLNGRIPPPA
jgi:hypothetical protein